MDQHTGAIADRMGPLGRIFSRTDARIEAEGEMSERTAVVRLLLSSFLMLFVELALIRWLGANVVHLSYFSNFVLLGSFLGIGAGFLISRKSWSIWPVSLPLLTMLVIGVLKFPVSIERSATERAPPTESTPTS